MKIPYISKICLIGLLLSFIEQQVTVQVPSKVSCATWKSKIIKAGILFVLILLNSHLCAQMSFSDASSKLPNYTTFYSFLHQAVADMNQDGRDDIVRADNTGKFYILYQQADGTFSPSAIGPVQNITPLSIVLADLNNDGILDILTGGAYNGVRVVSSNASSHTYSVLRLPQDSIYTQASAIADIDRDGLLDIFVCHDEGTSAIWRNLGNASFQRNNLGIDLNTVPPSNNSGNYGSVFTDFDNDGDIDLYISKCSAYAPTDSTDPRRINQLFVNQGNGVFLEQAKMFNMADSSQTWVTEFQDIDNDGDLDAFIANHYWPSRLMLNDGHGHFTDITSASGLLGTVPNGILHALMQDFDNDGYMDILVSGIVESKLFKNNHDLTFTPISLPLTNPTSNTSLRSFAWGDLNADGFLDLYTSYYYGNTDPDRLWLNDKNSNHFLSVKLMGTISNKSSIGARIAAKIGTKTIIREIRAGESYGMSNSLTQVLGLGATTNIDKLSITWPSGRHTERLNVAADQFLTFVEPDCPIVRCVEVKIVKNK